MPRIALVSPPEDLEFEEVERVAAALEAQVRQDLAPVWEVKGAVEPFHAIEDVPDDAWPLSLVRATGLGPAVAGYHQVRDGRPFGEVSYRNLGWSVVASHQCLEMLVDPYVDRFIPGPSPRPDGFASEFLVEICDPCQATPYHVEGVAVSDFVTPAYYTGEGEPYSHTGTIEQPRHVPRGGYLRWRERDTGHWWRLSFFGSQPDLEDLGTLEEEVAPAIGRPAATKGDPLEAVRGIEDEVHAYVVARAVDPEVLAGLEVGGHHRRTGEGWIAAVEEVYRPGVDLDGPLVVLGLSILDPPLREALIGAGRLEPLEAQLHAPLATLIDTGAAVRPLSDRPTEDDHLEREPYARFLADLLAGEREGSDQPFLMHLYGAWGSGKTSLLTLLGRALGDRDPPWLIVWFNAWQHERLGPPWWSLLTAVHRQALGPGSIRLWLLDLAWRVRLGWMAYLLLPAVLALLWVGWQEDWFDGSQLSELGSIATAAAAILGLIVTLLGAARGLGRSLSASSARGAETFMRNSRDPMRTLTRRFNRLVRATRRPVAVFVDDLDRCQASYVVDLLQGIQTLLMEAPVSFVVAADRRWLYDSYAHVYSDFTSAAREPGRPLGHLFLEKTFQLSAPLPNVLPDQRDAFWRRLIAPAAPAPEPVDPQPVQSIRDAPTAAEAIRRLDAATPHSPEEGMALKQATLERLSDADVRARTERELGKFSSLLEPNPRAMKRLVNAYSVAQALHVLDERVFLSLDELALWTLLSMRWPLLAECLTEHPEAVADGAAEALEPELRALLQSPEVRRVLRGGTVTAPLTAGAVAAITGR